MTVALLFAVVNIGQAALRLEERRDGTLSPSRRASEIPIAIACLRFLTGRRPPDLSWPCLYSCITLPIFFDAFFPYRRPLLLRLLEEPVVPRRELLRLVERFDADFVPRCEPERLALADLRPEDLRPLLLRDRDDVLRELDDLRLVVAMY